MRSDDDEDGEDLCVCVCVCIHTYIYIYIYIYIYTYTYTYAYTYTQFGRIHGNVAWATRKRVRSDDDEDGEDLLRSTQVCQIHTF